MIWSICSSFKVFGALKELMLLDRSDVSDAEDEEKRSQGSGGVKLPCAFILKSDLNAQELHHTCKHACQI